MPDQRPVAIANTSPLQYLHQCGLTDHEISEGNCPSAS
jgi:hypothetical protein